MLCGCGRKVRFGRKSAANAVGTQFDNVIALFSGAAERGNPRARGRAAGARDQRDRLRDQIRRIVHGEMDRKRYEKKAGRAWMAAAAKQRKRLAGEAIEADYAGWDALAQSQLANAGARAPAVLADVRDTGMTINEDPRVEMTLRVEPPDEEPFEVRRKVTVSRVEIPRRGERVEVAYGPRGCGGSPRTTPGLPLTPA